MRKRKRPAGRIGVTKNDTKEGLMSTVPLGSHPLSASIRKCLTAARALTGAFHCANGRNVPPQKPANEAISTGSEGTGPNLYLMPKTASTTLVIVFNNLTFCSLGVVQGLGIPLRATDRHHDVFGGLFSSGLLRRQKHFSVHAVIRQQRFFFIASPRKYQKSE